MQLLHMVLQQRAIVAKRFGYRSTARPMLSMSKAVVIGKFFVGKIAYIECDTRL